MASAVTCFSPLQLCACKELQLPASQFDYTAEQVAVTSAGPLDAAPAQAVSALAVSAEGAARLWPSLSQEGNYAEADLDLGDPCAFVLAVSVSRDRLRRSFSSSPSLQRITAAS